MKFRSDSKRAVNEYKAAKRDQLALQDEQKRAGITEETEDYREANSRTAEAAEKVSWFRR